MTLATQLSMRTYAGEADATEIVRVVNAASAADRVEEVWTAEALVAWLGHASEQFDPARDVVLVELDGRVVATGRVEWVDTRDGLHREYRIGGSVDPAFQGRGIGTALLADLEQRARGLAAEQRPDRDVALMAVRTGRALLERICCAAPATKRRAGSSTWFARTWMPSSSRRCPRASRCGPVTPDQYETIWRAEPGGVPGPLGWLGRVHRGAAADPRRPGHRSIAVAGRLGR